jgi:2-polyprenyl-6-methoxyphenol hydroxylase-like FAD-dependent oxidoreductase
MNRYDAIVVGARCAGAATALLLARAGRRVLLVERAGFPRDTLSTLYIQPRGVSLLRRWGLLDQVAAACPRLDRTSYQVGDVRLAGSTRPIDGESAAYAPRRSTLDTLLAEAAVAAGVEVRDSCAVRSLLFDEGRVVGVRLRTRTGTADEYARLVIGADGMRSTVADAVDAATLVEDSRKTCVYYGFWPGVSDHFELFEAQGRWIGAVPTNDGQTLVQAYFPQTEFDRVRADARDAYWAAVRDTAPDLNERMRAAGTDGRLYGTGDQRNFFRAAAGPGWALVGDAGHHRDSITALGITQAFRQAQLLADAVAPVLEDPNRLATALAEFARHRYAMLINDYHVTLRVARLSVPPHRIRLLREVAADPLRTQDFFTGLSGETRPAAELPMIPSGGVLTARR